MKKSTLIALAVFGVLAAAWALTRERQVSEGVHRLALTPVASEAIVSLELEGASPVILQARDGGWSVAASTAKEKAWTADVGLAQNLARVLAEVKSAEFVTERPERQAELEVDPAKGVALRASTASGVVRDLVVGKASKSGGTYVRAAGSNEVYSVSSALTALAHRPLRDWRDKRIPVGALDEVTRVQVEPVSGAGFVLVKDPAWRLEGAAPAAFRFDPDAAQRLVSQLTTLTAQDFLEGPLLADEPETSITVTLATGHRALHLGPAAPDGSSPLRIEGEAQRWVLPQWSADQLRKGLEGLRDLRVLHFEASDVERVSVMGKNRALAVRTGAQGWKLAEPARSPPGFEFDPNQVDALLTRLASLRATRVAEVAPGKAGLGAPTIELGLKQGGKVALVFGAQAGAEGPVYAKGTEASIFELPTGQKTSLEAGLDLFKKPPPPPRSSGAGLQGLDQLPPEVRAKLEAQLRAQGR
jgi:hypothetical protein